MDDTEILDLILDLLNYYPSTIGMDLRLTLIGIIVNFRGQEKEQTLEKKAVNLENLKKLKEEIAKSKEANKMTWKDDCDYCDYHMEFISIFGEWCFCELKRPEHDQMRGEKLMHCDYVCHDTLKERMCKKTQIPIL